MKFVVLLTICLSIWFYNNCQAEIIVSPKCGKVRGVVRQTRSNVNYYAFQGIPYAEAPIGYLRFREAVPKKPWTEIFDASRPGKICYQPKPQYRFFMSEDCLQVNVYTKTLAPDAKKPVMVYIHGGSLIIGSGTPLLNGPTYLMERDVVIVTLNYRLGLFGFLATGTKEAPGNMGFKDQNLALKWVRDNIMNFGGDPDSVTIFGQSAGARSVAVHMASPMSAGLFHRAIIMSGSTTHQWRVQSDQLDLADRIGTLYDCGHNSTGKLVDCLREMHVWNLTMAINAFNEFEEHPILKVFPVIESNFGQERFLTEDPQVSFKTGNFNKVPVIVGVTRDEFVESAYKLLLGDKKDLEKFNADFDKYAPFCFLYENEDEFRRQNITDTLKTEFLAGNELTESNVEAVGKVVFIDLTCFEDILYFNFFWISDFF